MIRSRSPARPGGHNPVAPALLLLASLSLSLAASLNGCTRPGSTVTEKPVLKINAREISAKEFAEALAKKLRSFDALYAKDDRVLARVKEQTVNAFVLETLTRDFAAEQKISVSSEELEQEAQRIRGRYPDDNAFRRSLADENVSFDQWRVSLQDPLLQRKIAAHLNVGLPEPTEADLKANYEKNKSQWHRPARAHIRQIVLAKEEEALRMSEELAKGGNMAQLAKTFSIGPEAENGGDVGWMEKGAFETFDAAFKLKPGARTKPIKSPFGFHILELIAKEPDAHLSFNEAKARIRSQMMEQREQATYSSWLEGQAKKAKVMRDDALIRSIQITTRGN